MRLIKQLFISLALMAGLVPPVFANTILLAPTGTTLTTGQVRAEAAFSPDNDNGRYYWLATGLQQVEANVIRLEKPNGDSENLIGLQWNFLPETMITPAISFGIRDAAVQSAEGFAIYAAVTKHLSFRRMPFVEDFAATAGIGALGIRGPFMGFEAKLPWKIFVQGEYDSHDFNGAIGWQPLEIFRIKAYSIRRDFYFGAELVPITF